nr:MAG TPA: hypothetical protein [Caudoviricetes sp.]
MAFYELSHPCQCNFIFFHSKRFTDLIRGL